MSYESAHSGRTETYLTNTSTDDDASLSLQGSNGDEIFFDPYDNPNVSVDTSARFAVHDIIGGTTVRQKIGEEPTEISISGVCTEEVAADINELRRASFTTLITAQLNSAARCQIASASTDPLEDGGTANMDGGEFLYEFSINLVEVTRE